MPIMKLTAKTVEKVRRPRAGRIEYFDASLPGFALRVTARGKRSFVIFYRVQQDGPDKGRLRRYTLEPVYPALTLAKARKRAGDILAEVAEGQDPAKEKQRQKKAAPPVPKHELTFGEAVGEFVSKYAKPRQRTWRETERTLRVNCAGWLDQPIAEISKRDAYDLLDRFVADGHGYKARRTLSWLRTMFRWAAERDIVPASVMETVKVEFEEHHRERFYTDLEIAAVWKAADDLAPLEGGYVKLLTLLGVRKGELAGMRRTEFDDPDRPRTWTIPFERIKARKGGRRREYTVPMPKLAQRIIRSLPRADDDLIFPGWRHGRPLDPGTPLKIKVQEASGIKDWTYHACRHTVATWLKNQGHSTYARSLILNHAEAGVTAGYSHGDAIDLKRKLLEEWAGHVAALAQPKGVVRLT